MDSRLKTAVAPRRTTASFGVSQMLQRQCACGQHTHGGECEECGKRQTLQRKPAAGDALDAVPSIVDDVLRSPGQPLDHATRTFMQTRFGHDFSNVKVHSDAHAADSAEAVNALAYTVGHDVVFGAGQYRPGTVPGDRLLAHELTHVLQQQGSVQSGAIRLMDSASHEAEADRIGTAVNAWVPSPDRTAHDIHSAPTNVVQRTVAGDVAGGVVGAGVGAGIGALAGGPVGAVLGGLLGGLVGVALGDLASAETRELTQGEREEARLVFGTSLNYGSVKVADATILSRLTRGNAVTPFETIYFPAGAFVKDFSRNLNGMAWLIHEMTHAWQYQHGVSVLEKAFVAAHGTSAYDYHGEAGLRSATAQGRRFTSFNTEQQADIMRDYYRALKKNVDTSAYEPFVAEVQSGGTARGTLNDRNMRAPSPSSAVA